MTNSTTVPPDPAPPEPAPAGPRPTAARPLTRSRDDRVIAGVCGGVGRYLGVDPVLFRVLLPVLAVFGGSGIVLYALGWLLIPEEGAAESEAQRLVRGRGSGVAVLALVAVLVGVLAVADLAHSGPFGGLALLALIVALVVYARRERTDRNPRGVVPDQASAAADPAEWPTAPVAAGSPVPYSMPAPAPRQRSPLGLATVSVALLAAGVLLVADRAGVLTMGTSTVLATALVVVGAGLVVGAWLGRARWLIAVGVPLAVALLAVNATPRAPLAGGVGERMFTPATVANVRPAYRLGIGDATVDLSRVAFAGARRDVTASVGVGELSVVVPRTVDVTVRGRVGLGELRVFDARVGGSGVRRTVTVPAQGTSQGSLDLAVEVGVGHVEVRRASA